MKTFNACCNNCGWRGSEFKLLFSKDGIFCPKCESEDIIQFGKPQTKTPDEIAKGFADWVRNGLTNVEYSVDRIDQHLSDFKKLNP